jgi:hypothetical protein
MLLNANRRILERLPQALKGKALRYWYRTPILEISVVLPPSILTPISYRIAFNARRS